jgi:UDP-N-acetylmuramate dehydrogenase
MSLLKIENLPVVRGRYVSFQKLSELTWFKVGGPADVVFRPADADDLSFFLSELPKDVPVTIIGAGSNLLVRDGGLPGVVVRLGRGFSNITRQEYIVEVGAAVLDRTLSLTCQEAGIKGFEFLVGIPGTIGGAVKMNAGAYGKEVKDCLLWADVLDLDGKLHRLSNQDFNFSYRHSDLPPGWIVVKAAFQGEPGNAADIAQHLQKILQEREETQPVKGRTGGSTFKNPPGHSAWKLIDEAGCRGLQIGEAQVSTKHCNFLLNLEACSSKDLETLGETVRSTVLEKTGISLEWEIIRLGID